MNETQPPIEIAAVAGMAVENAEVPVTLNVSGGGGAYTLPFAEGFEDGVLPDSWANEYVSGTTDWEFTYGVNGSHPADPHGGAFNAYFNGSTGDMTKLITPQIDMGAATEVILTFWHAHEVWYGDQDVLRVYYKDSAGAAWTLLAEYLDDVEILVETQKSDQKHGTILTIIGDHKHLNDTPEMSGIITTCENQINVIWDLLVDDLLMNTPALNENTGKI